MCIGDLLWLKILFKPAPAGARVARFYIESGVPYTARLAACLRLPDHVVAVAMTHYLTAPAALSFPRRPDDDWRESPISAGVV
jgi:hypothetical protein